MEQLFIENRTLVFAADGETAYNPVSCLLPSDITEASVSEIKERLNRFPLHAILYINCKESAQAVFNRFIARFPVIEAAGGIVCALTPEGESRYLYIYRNQMWDLPKGKKEAGETDQENALREVAEETGMQNLHIKDYICTTYHIFSNFEKQICIKKSNWFGMETDTLQNPVPQTEEGITQARWLSYAEIQERLPLMYASIAYLSNRFFADHAAL